MVYDGNTLDPNLNFSFLLIEWCMFCFNLLHSIQFINKVSIFLESIPSPLFDKYACHAKPPINIVLSHISFNFPPYKATSKLAVESKLSYQSKIFDWSFLKTTILRIS